MVCSEEWMTLTPQSDLKAGYSFLAIFQSDMKGFRKSVHNASPSSECSVARETLQRMFSASGLNTWLERVSREHRGFQKYLRQDCGHFADLVI